MSVSNLSLEDAPFGAFHRRLALYSCGGPFCDGYILGIIAIALGPLSKDIGLTPSDRGLIAAASLIGMFIGGSIFGFLTDLVGRRTMYALDLLLFVVASAAQFWVQGVWTLFALRLVLGVAIGADYPIVSALMAEFAPKRQRGMLLAGLIGAWWLGYTVSFVVGYALSSDQGSAWRWMLASSAAPAALVSVLRWGIPESPLWLAAKGRSHQARELLRIHLGGNYQVSESPPIKTNCGRIFDAQYRTRTILSVCFGLARLCRRSASIALHPKYWKHWDLPIRYSEPQ